MGAASNTYTQTVTAQLAGALNPFVLRRASLPGAQRGEDRVLVFCVLVMVVDCRAGGDGHGRNGWVGICRCSWLRQDDGTGGQRAILDNTRPILSRFEHH